MSVSPHSAPSAPSRVGRLFYLVGASGSGKDALMRHAREVLADAGLPVLFAHRYITRAVHDAAENHVALGEAEFLRRLDAGLFALHWAAHGYRYGLGIEIDLWRERGFDVVVNGARRHLPVLRAQRPDARVIWITADVRTRAARLARRGREDAAQIAARLAVDPRGDLGVEPLSGDTVIDNGAALVAAGAALVEVLRGRG